MTQNQTKRLLDEAFNLLQTVLLKHNNTVLTWIWNLRHHDSSLQTNRTAKRTSSSFNWPHDHVLGENSACLGEETRKLHQNWAQRSWERFPDVDAQERVDQLMKVTNKKWTVKRRKIKPVPIGSCSWEIMIFMSYCNCQQQFNKTMCKPTESNSPSAHTQQCTEPSVRAEHWLLE